eukprot:153853-Prymnesium_polylepis.1
MIATRRAVSANKKHTSVRAPQTPTYADGEQESGGGADTSHRRKYYFGGATCRGELRGREA